MGFINIKDINCDDLLKHLNDNLSHFIAIECTHCEITIESRPCHCNRGRFLVKVFPYVESVKECHVDEDDMFPRNYFFLDHAIKEIFAWIKIRKLIALKIVKMPILAKCTACDEELDPNDIAMCKDLLDDEDDWVCSVCDRESDNSN